MTIPVLVAAKRLAERSGWSLSNLELQKILYLAHMFHLGRTGEPLVAGNFQAWEYGPVHPELYHHAKIFGSSPVENVFHSVPTLPEGPEAAIIDEALRGLQSARPGQLVAATHRKDGAWDKNYVPGARGIVIPNHHILEEYNEMERRKERSRVAAG